MMDKILWRVFFIHTEWTQYIYHVLRHKYLVYKIGRLFGLPIFQLFMHDMDKFRNEWYKAYLDYWDDDNPLPLVDRWLISLERNYKYKTKGYLQNWCYDEDMIPIPGSMPVRYALEQAVDFLVESYETHGSFMAEQWFDDFKVTLPMSFVTENLIGHAIESMERRLRRYGMTVRAKLDVLAVLRACEQAYYDLQKVNRSQWELAHTK